MVIPDGLLIANGLDAAYLGYIERTNEPRVAVYDMEKCIQVFMEDEGMSREEAEEWFDYNVAGAYVGAQTPAYLVREDESQAP